MYRNNPKISVIISTYNRAKLLPRAIESVLKQNFKDYELIIVDDGSTDNTDKIVNEYIKKDNKIKYIKLKENSGGPSKPHNTGIKNSKGEYITFLDSDDEWFQDKLEKQIKVYEENKNNNIGLVGCKGISINKKSKEKNIIQVPHSLEKKSSEALKRTIPHSLSSVMIKKSVFKDTGFFDENIKISVDYELYIRISRKYKFIFIQEPLFNYYIHNNNISRLNNATIKKKIENRQKTIEKHKNIFLKNKRIYSNELRKTGTFYILEDNNKLARKKFIQAIKINPFTKIYINLITSLWPWLYKKIIIIKSKLKN